MQDSFHLTHRTVRHAPPKLANTIRALCDLLREHKAHEFHDGRKSYELTDHVHDGIYKYQTKTTVHEQDSDNLETIESNDGEVFSVDEEMEIEDFEAL